MKLAITLSLLFAAIGLGELTGQYTGTWASDAGVNSGKVTIALAPGKDTEVTFTYQDQPVKPQKVATKVTDDRIELVSEFDLEGYHLKSTFVGKVDGKTITGKYTTTAGDDGASVDSGTWKVTQP